MYSEWKTLYGYPAFETNTERFSVLEKLPYEVAKEVIHPVVRHIVSTIGISQPAQPSSMQGESEVDWCLQVLCFGLNLPFSEQDIIKDCVSIYCDWLSCLMDTPNVSVPTCIVDQPNFYARKMINQLHLLFVPRKGEAQDVINKQAVLCHRVLRVLQNVIKTSNKLNNETWEATLLFLISINDALLSPPTIEEDIGDQLCERVLSVLFEIWFLACQKCYPSPSLWKTLRTTCQSWRHRPGLFIQWNRINLFLSRRVIQIMYGSNYIDQVTENENLSSVSLSDDGIVQTWFRFLHCLGNPVELTQPALISQTQSFLQYAISSEDVVDPCQHPCLLELPSIFSVAVRGISNLVDAFLGAGLPPQRKHIALLEAELENIGSTLVVPEVEHEIKWNASPVAPIRRLAKSFSVATSTSIHKGLPKTSMFSSHHGGSSRSKDTSSIPSQHSSISSVTSGSHPASIEWLSTDGAIPSANRPKVNSILHLFGPWLFQAGLISENPKTTHEYRRTSRGSAVPAALPESVDIPTAITIDKYFEGKAEALGTLCRIFCSKKTGEDILPAYLARFYVAVKRGLQDPRSEVLTSILSNCSDLFKLDLDGISILMPSIIAALETVLPYKNAFKNSIRKSSIQLLLSLLPLPLHFLNVPIKDVFSKGVPAGQNQIVTFLQFKQRLVNLVINTLQVENDSVNIHMLLGGIVFLICDLSIFEEVEKTQYNALSSSGSPVPLTDFESESLASQSDSVYSSTFDDHSVNITLSEPECHSITAAGIFMKAAIKICERLTSSWKTDLAVSLAALEVLNGLAKARLAGVDDKEYCRIVRWICDYIIHQSSRPPQAHSRDLHSSIVAAYACVTSWVLTHPSMLQDKETLWSVLEVVELGISGSKSQGKHMRYKDDKDLKPVSLRVKDAAEALLAVIFEQAGRNIVSCSSSNIPPSYSRIDELTLFQNVLGLKDCSYQEVIKKFRFYVLDQSILLAVLEEGFREKHEACPSMVAILRGPTGRSVWNMELRQLPRYKGKSYYGQSSNPGRPLPMNDVGTAPKVTPKYFPDGVDRISLCKADKAMCSPIKDDFRKETENKEKEDQLLNNLTMIIENQIRLEKRVQQMIEEDQDKTYPNLRTEATSQPPASEFQTARIFLTHLGLTGNSVTENRDPKLVPLDSSKEGFLKELQTLDATCCRTYDFVNVFYVRSGQRKAAEILSNIAAKVNLDPHFLEFLQSLGWRGAPAEQFEDPNKYDIQKEVVNLRWKDAMNEMAFVLPGSRDLFAEDKQENLWHTQNRSDKPEATSNKEHNSKKSPPVETGTIRPKRQDMIVRIMLVWLESLEDMTHFPSEDMLATTKTSGDHSGSSDSKSVIIIFVHALKNGLFRIHTQGQSLRMGPATPLTDGMLVSRRVLGDLVRQTALNMAKRKRLENENFHPPHVRRKQKIQEIMNKFALNLPRHELNNEFFSSKVVSIPDASSIDLKARQV